MKSTKEKRENMKKTKEIAKPKKAPARAKATRETKKNAIDYSVTSISFRKHTLEGLKNHDICHPDKNNLSVTWVVNKLVDKFLAGEIHLELE